MTTNASLSEVVIKTKRDEQGGWSRAKVIVFSSRACAHNSNSSKTELLYVMIYIVWSGNCPSEPKPSLRLWIDRYLRKVSMLPDQIEIAFWLNLRQSCWTYHSCTRQSLPTLECIHVQVSYLSSHHIRPLSTSTIVSTDGAVRNLH